MKIAFIISSLSSGGAERVLSLLANSFSRNNEVYILTFSNDESFYQLHQNIKHIKLNLLKESKTFSDSFKNSLSRFFAIKKELRNLNVDIIVSFMTHTNILSTIASKLNHQKIIISERIAYDFHQSKLLNILRKIVYRYADLLIVQTHADKDNYKFIKNVEVIYNPLKLSNLKTKKERIVLAVGRLEKQKGFNKLIEAFSQIDSRGWSLCIAGDGLEKKNLQKQIETLELNNVQLIGKRKDIFEWYARSSIFVLSSEKEGFPNVLLEAMGSGCACLSFNCPFGPSEIIKNGINGILVEDQNLSKFSQELQKLINDDELRDKLSYEAIKIKNCYSLEKIMNEWSQLMNKVLND